MFDSDKAVQQVKIYITNIVKAACLLIILGIIKFFLSSAVCNFIFGKWFEVIERYYWLFVSLGIIPAILAQNKGRSFWLWWIIASFSPIVSFLIVLTLEGKEKSRNNDVSS